MPCECKGMAAMSEQILADRVTELTQLLCFACGMLEEYGIMCDTLKPWWDIHLEDDTERVTAGMIEFLNTNPDVEARHLAKVFIAKAEDVHYISDWHNQWFHELAIKCVALKGGL